MVMHWLIVTISNVVIAFRFECMCVQRAGVLCTGMDMFLNYA